MLTEKVDKKFLRELDGKLRQERGKVIVDRYNQKPEENEEVKRICLMSFLRSKRRMG